jgi:hypothetical protein
MVFLIFSIQSPEYYLESVTVASFHIHNSSLIQRYVLSILNASLNDAQKIRVRGYPDKECNLRGW